jgi:hypothetical protein
MLQDIHEKGGWCLTIISKFNWFKAQQTPLFSFIRDSVDMRHKSPPGGMLTIFLV